MTVGQTSNRRVFHIYLSGIGRIACDAPDTEVETVVAERCWRRLDAERLCAECVRVAELGEELRPGSRS